MQATILLIDDNAVQAATRQAILRRAGYFVVVALSPQRALEKLSEGSGPEEIDMVITDHLMPMMQGCEFVMGLRQYDAKLPVLVISGMEEAEAEYAGLNVHFRVKPLLPTELLDVVGRILADAV